MGDHMISILIPHLREPKNDQALAIALDCIASNTDVDYELIVEACAEKGGVYDLINHMAERAKSEWLVFSNSDVFFAPGWASAMWDARQRDTIVTGILVECGAIGVNDQNIHRDFGMTPETFRRREFEYFAAGCPLIDGDGWYFPSLHNTEAFLDMGGFDTSQGDYPVPLDIFHWRRWREEGGKVRRVRSLAFHLQRWSDPSEQTKPVRHQEWMTNG